MASVTDAARRSGGSGLLAVEQRGVALHAEHVDVGTDIEVAVRRHVRPVDRGRQSGVEGKSVSVRVDLGGRRTIQKQPTDLAEYMNKHVVKADNTHQSTRHKEQ